MIVIIQQLIEVITSMLVACKPGDLKSVIQGDKSIKGHLTNAEGERERKTYRRKTLQ